MFKVIDFIDISSSLMLGNIRYICIYMWIFLTLKNHIVYNIQDILTFSEAKWTNFNLNSQHILIFFSCTILDNFYVEKPIWMVDLGEKTKISGLIVITWQGQGQGNVYKGICALTVCCLIPLSSCLNECH